MQTTLPPTPKPAAHPPLLIAPPHHHQDQRRGDSFVNETEAANLRDLVAWLRRGPAAAASVGVICLYKAQVRGAPIEPYLGPYLRPYLALSRPLSRPLFRSLSRPLSRSR